MEADDKPGMDWCEARTLKDVPGTTISVTDDTQIQQVIEFFNQDPELNGLLLFHNGGLCGMVTRDKLFEVLGRPYGNEVFRKKTIHEFSRRYGFSLAVFNQDERVDAVVVAALNRQPMERYMPIVVKKDSGTYALVDMVTLLTIQNQILAGLYQQVQHLSVIDPLTRVYNRRGFWEIWTREQEPYGERGRCVSLLMIDIDHFKAINDRFGHQAGDMVLQSVAALCNSFTREKDMIMRYGGEEFCILLLDTDLYQAEIISERIRKRVEELVTSVDSQRVQVTISIGVTSRVVKQQELEQLFTEADRAMYRAKQQGRNRVVSFSVTDAPPDELFSLDFSPEVTPTVNFCDETIRGWVKTLEMRDRETEGHTLRVAEATVEFASRLGLAPEQLDRIRRGALMHDIGKIAIPDEILFKPDKLTPEEWAVMRQHPVYAREFLSTMSFMADAIDIPLCHHEHWDGSGYPRGLRGEEIPLYARVFTIVDVWDALRSDRRYRKAWKEEDVKAYLIEQKGKLFDPNLVDTFIEMCYPQSGEALRIDLPAEIHEKLP